MNYDKKCQLLVIGNSAVGKSSILRRFTQDKFNPNYFATVGIDFFTKDVILDDKIIHIKIWDTAGQERYKSLTQGFFRNAQGIIIVYDITNQTSFDDLKYWIQSIENNINLQNKIIPAIIIGNKIDILEREVDNITAENFAKEIKYKYFEVSAKSGKGVDEAIKYLIKKVIEVIDKENKDENINKSIKINSEDEKNKDKLKKDKCCNKN